MKHNETLSDSFPISNGVKQGCFLAPHCSPSSSASCFVKLKRTYQTASTSVFQTNGSLFSLRRLLARTKTIEELITELLFAELTVSLKKTEVLYQHLHERLTVILTSASMAQILTQWNTSLTWVASSPMMPQSARILITACPKPTVPLEDCQRQYGRATRSASSRSSRYTGLSSLPPSCMMQRPGFSIGGRSGSWSDFTNAACAPSLASNGQTTC